MILAAARKILKLSCLAGVFLEKRLAQIVFSITPSLQYSRKRLYLQETLSGPLWGQIKARSSGRGFFTTLATPQPALFSDRFLL
jgi:hypothetical protein